MGLGTPSRYVKGMPPKSSLAISWTRLMRSPPLSSPEFLSPGSAVPSSVEPAAPRGAETQGPWPPGACARPPRARRTGHLRAARTHSTSSRLPGLACDSRCALGSAPGPDLPIGGYLGAELVPGRSPRLLGCSLGRWSGRGRGLRSGRPGQGWVL